MTSFVQVLGSQPYLSNSRLLICHNGFYGLINAGENTQRLAIDYGIPLTKIQDIFLSCISPETFLGLPGLLLTLETSDGFSCCNLLKNHPKTLEWISFQGPLDHCRSFKRRRFQQQEACFTTRQVRIWGPPPLFELFKQLTRHIAFLGSLDLEIHEVLPTAIPQPALGLPSNTKDHLKFQLWCIETQHPNKKRKFLTAPQMNTDGYTLMIRVIFPCQPGQLIMDKVATYGIPRGPLLGKLKSGQSIQLDNETWIHTSMVCDHPKPGGEVLILDDPSCPWDSLLKDLLIQWNQHREKETPFIVYLMFPTRSFVNRPNFPKDVILVSCSHDDFLTRYHPFPSSQSLSELFKSLAPQLCYTLFNNDMVEENRKELCLPRYIFFPMSKRGMVESDFVSSSTSRFSLTKCTQDSDYPDTLSECQELLRECLDLQNKDEMAHGEKQLMSFCTIQFLGTGAAMPSKYRNVSGCMVQLRHPQEHFNILLDCGEGTLSQMLLFSADLEDFKKNLENLGFIFISHHHADHHLGLVSVLAARHYFFPNKPPPIVYGGRFLEEWLSFWVHHVRAAPYSFISSDDTPFVLLPNLTEQWMHHIEFQAIPVDHTTPTTSLKGSNFFYGQSYGIKLTIQNRSISSDHDPLKIVYSGDTRPCQNLVTMGKDCDVLIHEATFEDDLKDDATSKRHSTFTEALEIGTACDAKLILLTHFSQRYISIPTINHSQWNFAAMMDGVCVPLRILLHEQYLNKFSQAFHKLSLFFNKLSVV